MKKKTTTNKQTNKTKTKNKTKQRRVFKKLSDHIDQQVRDSSLSKVTDLPDLHDNLKYVNLQQPFPGII